MLNTSIKYSVLALSSALTQAAYANDIPDIERVTVYGALSTTPLSEMPSSIDVISQLAIEQRHAQHLDEILNKAGNVNFVWEYFHWINVHLSHPRNNGSTFTCFSCSDREIIKNNQL